MWWLDISWHWDSHHTPGYLKNSISLPLSRVICKGSRLSSWIKRVPVLGAPSEQFLQKWASLRCTVSILLIWCFWCGDHTELAYSKCGRTTVLYASTFTWSGHRLRFLLTKPSDLLALTITFSACLFQLRLLVNSTPRYGWLSNASSVFLLLISYWMLNWVLFPSLWVLNDSLPLSCPLWQFVLKSFCRWAASFGVSIAK